MTRVSNVRKALEKLEVPAMFVSNLVNVRYLANFTGSAGAVLITPENQYFITDFRYTTQASQQAVGFTIRIHTKGIYQEVADILKEEGIIQLAIEGDDLSANSFDVLDDKFEGVLIKTSQFIENIRAIKSEDEIAIIKEACEITDQAFDHILSFIKPGMTERQVALELEAFLKAKGASEMSFDTIVASGYRSAMPHGVASDKVIETGDLITLDFGCYYKGYSSDMTRTIALGSVDPKLEEIYHIVLEAHNRVSQAAKAGITGAELDAVARDYITEKGYGENFGHGTGHGLGMDVHEQPSVSKANQEPLVVNNVVTNEPGIYIEGLGGVRIEDDLVIQADGAYSLNKSPKHLIIL